MHGEILIFRDSTYYEQLCMVSIFCMSTKRSTLIYVTLTQRREGMCSSNGSICDQVSRCVKKVWGRPFPFSSSTLCPTLILQTHKSRALPAEE